jgi:hypothetical protein
MCDWALETLLLLVGAGLWLAWELGWVGLRMGLSMHSCKDFAWSLVFLNPLLTPQGSCTAVSVRVWEFNQVDGTRLFVTDCFKQDGTSSLKKVIGHFRVKYFQFLIGYISLP